MKEGPHIIDSHRFRIEIEDVTQEGSQELFISVGGLKVSRQTRSYLPGGYSTPFEIPIATRTSDIVLVRHLTDNMDTTDITKWCIAEMYKKKVKPTSLKIFMLHPDESIAAQWSVDGVFPKDIETSPTGLENGPTNREIITLGCSSIIREK